jgi:hypothetical protein
MNTFFKTTSDGGYLGRFCWINSGVYDDQPFGCVIFLPNVNPVLGDDNWAGQMGMLRLIVKGPPRERRQDQLSKG